MRAPIGAGVQLEIGALRRADTLVGPGEADLPGSRAVRDRGSVDVGALRSGFAAGRTQLPLVPVTVVEALAGTSVQRPLVVSLIRRKGLNHQEISPPRIVTHHERCIAAMTAVGGEGGKIGARSPRVWHCQGPAFFPLAADHARCAIRDRRRLSPTGKRRATGHATRPEAAIITQPID